MEQMKICYNNVNLVAISQCNFHHSTILDMPEHSAVDQPPEGMVLAIPARASLKPLIDNKTFCGLKRWAERVIQELSTAQLLSWMKSYS